MPKAFYSKQGNKYICWKMKFQSITIKDIAKDLKLSVSTISRALRDSHEISRETKKLVMDYAKKMNYRPNPIALSLQTKRNKSIGIIISQISNSFCSQVINGIESVAYEKGYQISIVQTDESYKREVEAADYLSSRVDGLLISLASETKDISHFQSLDIQGMPMVFFDRVTTKIATHKTISDNYQGAYKAVEHLINEGFTKIAFIGGSKNLDIVQERNRGYIEALKDNQIKPLHQYIKYCPLGGIHFSETEKVLKELLRLKEKPDAILSCWDKVTADCYRYFRDNSIKMPEEIALIGFSNFPLTDYVCPSLSVIQQQSEGIGIKAATQLISLLEKKRKPETFDMEILMPELIIRASSKNKETNVR